MSHNHSYAIKTRADEILHKLQVLTSLALEHFEEHVEEPRVEEIPCRECEEKEKAIKGMVEQPGEMEEELKQMGHRLEDISLRLDDGEMETKMDH